MPSRAEIVRFGDSPPPPGASARVPGAPRVIGIEVTDPDPHWPQQYRDLAARIREALGWRALQLEHVGSTSVPGLAAKPVIDIDLTVADPARGEHVMQYNARKEQVIREIYHRAFVAAGLLDK
jgi:hypothetical protein